MSSTEKSYKYSAEEKAAKIRELVNKINSSKSKSSFSITVKDIKDAVDAAKTEFSSDLNATKTEIFNKVELDSNATKNEIFGQVKLDLNATKTEFSSDLNATETKFLLALNATKEEITKETDEKIKEATDDVLEISTDVIIQNNKKYCKIHTMQEIANGYDDMIFACDVPENVKPVYMEDVGTLKGYQIALYIGSDETCSGQYGDLKLELAGDNNSFGVPSGSCVAVDVSILLNS